MSGAIAAPTMTTMAAPVTYANYAAAPTMAAPVTYAAAPAVTMAAPVQYAAAPMAAYGTTTMAAPVTYAAPSYTPAPVQYASYAAPAIGRSQSYVAAPTQQYASYAAPAPSSTLASPGTWQAQSSGMPTLGVAMPKIEVGPPPTDLTVGIPNSQQIASQKAGYSAALDKQLADGITTIKKETDIEKQMVKFGADKQIALFQMQIEEQRNEQMALLDEQATIAVLELKKACVERKIQLDAQAAGLNMDYQMKFVQTELAQKTYVFQQAYAGSENKLLEQYNALVAGANKGTAYADGKGTAYA